MTRARATGGQKVQALGYAHRMLSAPAECGAQADTSWAGPGDARDLVTVGPLHLGVGMETEFWADCFWSGVRETEEDHIGRDIGPGRTERLGS